MMAISRVSGPCSKPSRAAHFCATTTWSTSRNGCFSAVHAGVTACARFPQKACPSSALSVSPINSCFSAASKIFRTCSEKSDLSPSESSPVFVRNGRYRRRRYAPGARLFSGRCRKIRLAHPLVFCKPQHAPRQSQYGHQWIAEFRFTLPQSLPSRMSKCTFFALQIHKTCHFPCTMIVF